MKTLHQPSICLITLVRKAQQKAKSSEVHKTQATRLPNLSKQTPPTQPNPNKTHSKHLKTNQNPPPISQTRPKVLLHLVQPPLGFGLPGKVLRWWSGRTGVQFCLVFKVFFFFCKCFYLNVCFSFFWAES